MPYFCYSCGKELELKEGHVSRQATCDYCKTDLHCCKNCSFYDTSAYNECHENNAERVLEKDRSNFCDCFKMNAQVAIQQPIKNDKEKAMEALKALFNR